MQSPAQLVTQARGLAQAGRYDDARASYRQAIAAMPRNPELLLELGVLAGQHGDLATARRNLEKALKLDRNDANITFNLGQVAKAEGRNERAAQFFRQTLDLDPTYHEALFDLGESLYLAGHAEEALKALEEATLATPDDPEAHHVKGLVLNELDRKVDARTAYRRALEINPHHVNACLNLAVVEAELGQPWVAQELVEGVERHPGVPAEAYALVARVLHLVGEPERAADYVDKAMAAGLNLSESLMTRANIAIDQGDFAAAEADLRKLADAKKDPAWAYYRLAFIKRLEPQAMSRLKGWAEDATRAPNFRASACFALYNLLDQAGDHEQAFEVLRQANGLKARIAAADTGRQIDEQRRIARTFTADFLAERAHWGSPETGPVYIFGMPRSGTTLTEQILAAHPAIHGGGERQDVARIRMRIADWPEGIASLDQATIARMGSDLHAKMTERSGGADFSTDKTPGNYVFVGLIRTLLPQARLIHVRRGIGGNMLSLYEQNFLRGLNYSYDLNDIAEVYRAHTAIMRHWMSTAKLTIHTVDYDALVSDPEPHIRALLDFIGVDFHPDCLRPELVKRAIKTASVWQVRQPITTASVERWKRYEKQLAPFVRAAGEAP